MGGLTAGVPLLEATEPGVPGAIDPLRNVPSFLAMRFLRRSSSCCRSVSAASRSAFARSLVKDFEGTGVLVPSEIGVGRRLADELVPASCQNKEYTI